MKRLFDTGDLADDQCKELASRLLEERIFVHETRTRFLDFGALWVKDEDLSRAREVLRTESALYAPRVLAKWERQWRIEYKNPGIRWFAGKKGINAFSIDVFPEAVPPATIIESSF